MDMFSFLGLVFSITILVCVYYYPAYLAEQRGHKHHVPILALTALLGWTYIFWAIAFVWALMDGEDPSKRKTAAKKKK